ncbi:WD40-repeat-containing domain protein [Geopyxis carbonaria]|nr:WD40-repeat-containing domain protein [Geopyxis carbonaria]
MPAIASPPLSRDAVPLSDTIHRFRPSKAFQHVQHGAEITSLDFDDRGEFCIAAAADETLQLYDCAHGRHAKTLFSKKYGCHLARFAHSASNVIYASTKENDTIRYLSLHDNSYIRYFKGHTRAVNALEVSPVDDQFISCAHDDTVRLWDLRSANAHGLLTTTSPSLATFDPSGIIFAVASHASSSILLYDLRNYDKQPFTTFTIADDAFLSTFSYPARMPAWSKLEFSNDGKLLLLGTRGHAHYVIDSFAENTSKFLFRVHRPRGPTAPQKVETSGDVCFTPDGRYIVGGQGEKGVLVWDTQSAPDEKKTLKPKCELADGARSMSSCVAFNPRSHVFATAHKEAVGCPVLVMVTDVMGCANEGVDLLAAGTACARPAAIAGAINSLSLSSSPTSSLPPPTPNIPISIIPPLPPVLSVLRLFFLFFFLEHHWDAETQTLLLELISY